MKPINVEGPFFINNLVSDQRKQTKDPFRIESTLSLKAILLLLLLALLLLLLLRILGSIDAKSYKPRTSPKHNPSFSP